MNLLFQNFGKRKDIWKYLRIIAVLFVIIFFGIQVSGRFSAHESLTEIIENQLIVEVKLKILYSEKTNKGINSKYVDIILSESSDISNFKKMLEFAEQPWEKERRGYDIIINGEILTESLDRYKVFMVFDVGSAKINLNLEDQKDSIDCFYYDEDYYWNNLIEKYVL